MGKTRRSDAMLLGAAWELVDRHELDGANRGWNLVDTKRTGRGLLTVRVENETLAPSIQQLS